MCAELKALVLKSPKRFPKDACTISLCSKSWAPVHARNHVHVLRPVSAEITGVLVVAQQRF